MAAIITTGLQLSGALAVVEPVCTALGEQNMADIDSHYVVWQDYRAGNFDIYMKDLDTGLEVPICTDSGHQRAPAISGNIVVWNDDGGNMWGFETIKMKNIATGEVSIVTDEAVPRNPDISGDIVVWQNCWNDICYKNIETLEKGYVNRNPAWQIYPAIDGNIVVWSRARIEDNNHYDIFMKNLQTGVESLVMATDVSYIGAEISQNRVVWDDYDSGIFIFDTESGITTEMTSESASLKAAPSICGDVVVWMDNRNFNINDGKWDIFMKNIATGVVRPVCMDPGWQSSPVISDNIVVWEDSRTGSSDLYMSRLDSDMDPPSTSVTLSPDTPNGDNGWYRKIPQIEMSSDEPGLTFYSWTSAQGPWTQYSEPISAPLGSQTLYYYSEDKAANKEPVQSLPVKTDNIAPAATILSPVFAPTVCSFSPIDSVYEAGLMFFGYNVSDEGGSRLLWNQGYLGTEYCYQEPNAIGRNVFQDMSTGCYRFEVRTRDYAGNTSTTHTKFVVVDHNDGAISGTGWFSSYPWKDKAFFDLSCSYEKKTGLPKGNFVLEYEIDNLKVSGKEIDWYLIQRTQDEAYIQGRGILNNTEPCTFRLRITDISGNDYQPNNLIGGYSTLQVWRGHGPNAEPVAEYEWFLVGGNIQLRER